MIKLTRFPNENVKVTKEGIESAESEDETTNDCLMETGTTSTTFSMDSSCNSMMSTIYEGDDCSMSSTDSESNNDYQRHRNFDSENTGESRYLQALDRSRQLEMRIRADTMKALPNRTHAMKIEISNAETMYSIDRIPFTTKRFPQNCSGTFPTMRALNAQSSPTYNVTKIPLKFGVSNTIQMGRTKVETKKAKALSSFKNASISETASNRLYLKGLEREKRLALLRNRRFSHLRSTLASTERSPTSLSNTQFNSASCKFAQSYKTLKRGQISSEVYNNGDDDAHKGHSHSKPSRIKYTQRLYALSKPMQEDGKKRREKIVRAQKETKEGRKHPKGKIGRVAASRLYYVGMGQLVALEQKRIMASEPGVYQSRLLPTIRSHFPACKLASNLRLCS